MPKVTVLMNVISRVQKWLFHPKTHFLFKFCADFSFPCQSNLFCREDQFLNFENLFIITFFPKFMLWYQTIIEKTFNFCLFLCHYKTNFWSNFDGNFVIPYSNMLLIRAVYLLNFENRFRNNNFSLNWNWSWHQCCKCNAKCE